MILKKDIKDVKPGKKIPGSSGYAHATEKYDYSHLLGPIARRNFSLTVEHNRDLGSLNAVVSRKGDQYKAFSGVGKLEGWRDTEKPSKLGISVAVIRDPEDRGKGLGTAMYEALYAHSYHKLGVKEVYGDEHSSLAHRVHKKLAAKHNLDYNPKPNYQENWSPDPEEPGAWDHKYGPYKYKLR